MASRRRARAKLAFFKMGQISLELIEPIGGPSTWKEFLDGHGDGVHHIAFRVKGMDDVLTYLNGKGLPTAQRGDYTGRPLRVRRCRQDARREHRIAGEPGGLSGPVLKTGPCACPRCLQGCCRQ